MNNTYVSQAFYTSHAFLYIFIFIILLFFLGYWFLSDDLIYPDEKDWKLHKYFTPLEIANLKHDSEEWYYNENPMCIGYGDWENKCPVNRVYCAGDGGTYGYPIEQLTAIKETLQNGYTVHRKCPLL